MGIRAAMKYAYSNTRVKAMESKLIRKDTFERMLAAKEPGSVAAMLLQTEYKSDVEKLGGTKTMAMLIDFALSKNLGRATSKLISVAPNDQREIMASIAGVWDVNNMKLVIEGVASDKNFDYISRYIVESEYVSADVVKEALGAKSVEGAIERLISKTPYSKFLKESLEAYRKTHNPLEAADALERAYYTELNSTLQKLTSIDRDAAALIRKRADMKNILTLMEAKKHGDDLAGVSSHLIPIGSLSAQALEKLFRESKNVEALAEKVKTFDLKSAVSSYQESKNKPILLFEIAMLNDIFKSALRHIRHSTLSFGVLIAFLYLKEIEAFTLRVLIKGKGYGLSDEEIRGMISWLR